MQNNFENNLPETLTWQAPSHIEAKRSSVWYLGFALISLGLLAFAFYTHSIMTFLTFVLLIIVTLIFSSMPSKEMTYKITKTGIGAGSIIYPYKVIKKFWIIYNPPQVKTLNFETTAYINNQISLQLGRQDPVQIKLILSKYLHEDLDQEESLTETLARKLKIWYSETYYPSSFNG